MAKSHYDRWVETFKPERNHLEETETCDGCMFETFGPELEHVRAVLKAEPDRVWTLIEGDNGKWYVSQGWHQVNRVGYLITKLPFDSSNPLHAKRYGAKDVLYV